MVENNDLDTSSPSNSSSWFKKKTNILISIVSILILTPLLLYTNCGNINDELNGETQTSETSDFDKDFLNPESSTTALTCLSGGTPTPCQTLVDTGENFSCAIVAGLVKCWGNNQLGQLGQGYASNNIPTPTTSQWLSKVTAIATGDRHACAVIGGKVLCWGANNLGQIGNGTTSPTVLQPYTIGSLSNIVDVTAGQNHTCALASNNKIWCWGNNQYGQLGTGNNTNAFTPVMINSLNGVTMVSAGGNNTCAVTGTQARCWGQNNFGQIGNGTIGGSVSNPFAIPSLPNVISISSGTSHNCAVINTGAAKCWGKNQNGQIGNGVLNTQTTPAQVSGLTSGITSISAGLNHTCAVTNTNTAKCWGLNSTGQLGNGVYSANNMTPQNVLSLPNTSQISAGFGHTCAVTGTYNPNSQVNIKCFGQGTNGQLGNGGVVNQNTQVTAVQNYSCCGWSQTSLVNAPSARISTYNNFNSVWTGSKMIIWGGSTGLNNGILLGDGGVYDPITNVWTSVSMVGAPSARYEHTAIWAGSPVNKMIVWGGSNINQWFNGSGLGDGGIYNPATNSWTPLTNTNAPSPRLYHSAVWTGTEMIVWGGMANGNTFNDGARYNPTSNSWTAISTVGAPIGRYMHTAIWAGPPVNRMIVWGGFDNGELNDGAMYNPANNTWTPISNINAPSARYQQGSVWTGTELIVWGGSCCGSFSFNNGGKFNPLTNTWSSISAYGTTNWSSHPTVWAGPPVNRMIAFGDIYKDSYNPLTNTWAPLCTSVTYPLQWIPNYHYLVWTGTQMIAWGGSNSGNAGNTGLIYTP